MIVAKHRVKAVVRPSELAIRLEKRWVMRDSLVQQIDRLQQIRFRATVTGTGKAHSQKKIFGVAVEIERGEISRLCWLNGQSLSSGDFGVNLPSDLSRDLAW